jgi:hypothetical protein
MPNAAGPARAKVVIIVLTARASPIRAPSTSLPKSDSSITPGGTQD